MLDKPISPLRQRMIDDMTARRLMMQVGRANSVSTPCTSGARDCGDAPGESCGVGRGF